MIRSLRVGRERSKKGSFVRTRLLSEGEKFLGELGKLPAETYEFYFSIRANQLGLGGVFDRNDLTLLYEASLSATSCNQAFNNRGDFGKRTKAQVEAYRTRLEREFMAGRDLFYASPGWQNLPESKREPVRQNFLRVTVRDDLMAW